MVRLAYKVWSGIAAGVFVIVALTDLSSSSPPPTPAASIDRAGTDSAAVSPPGPVSPAAPAEAEAGQPGETVQVTSVIDGDTFEVSGGRTVQVLGIDACEPGTYGGDQATESARSQLGGQTVTLVAEPGVNRDRRGHELRYVKLATGIDFGEMAVALDHTTVYDGHGAPASYLDDLRSRDDGPQVCTKPRPSSGGGSGGDVNWPSPGDQGLPDGALTGGYCAKKWWC
ncbi:thermonuclease family protein [Pseudonocardia xinjiangensis]|uniref:thermonuclease family protein n=1 Tax=Pseudonocardia xinjiangensis TaxID=75289 RepID=UPI003D8D6ADF